MPNDESKPRAVKSGELEQFLAENVTEGEEISLDALREAFPDGDVGNAITTMKSRGRGPRLVPGSLRATYRYHTRGGAQKKRRKTSKRVPAVQADPAETPVDVDCLYCRRAGIAMEDRAHPQTASGQNAHLDAQRLAKKASKVGAAEVPPQSGNGATSGRLFEEVGELVDGRVLVKDESGKVFTLQSL